MGDRVKGSFNIKENSTYGRMGFKEGEDLVGGVGRTGGQKAELVTYRKMR